MPAATVHENAGLIVVVARTGWNPPPRGLTDDVLGACRLIGGVECRRLEEALPRPGAAKAFEDADWMSPLLDDVATVGAVVIDTDGCLVHSYSSDRAVSQPRRLIDLSLEPLPIAIWEQDPTLFQAILEAFLNARIANALKPDPEVLACLHDKLDRRAATGARLVDGFGEFAADLVACIEFQMRGAGASPDCFLNPAGRTPPELAIAAMSNRASLLLCAANTALYPSEKREEFLSEAGSLWKRARELADKAGLSEFKRAVLSANQAALLNRQAEELAKSAPDHAGQLRTEAEALLRGGIALLAEAGTHRRVHIGMLLSLAATLAARSPSNPAVHTQRISALRSALKLCIPTHVGDAASVRRELAVAILLRPGISSVANIKEAVPHLRMASSLCREALAAEGSLNEKARLYTELVNTEIALHRLTQDESHASAAVDAARELQAKLVTAGRKEESTDIEELITRLSAQTREPATQ